MSNSALDKESLHFLGRLLAFLEDGDIPDGMFLDISVGLDYEVTPIYKVQADQYGDKFVLEPTLRPEG